MGNYVFSHRGADRGDLDRRRTTRTRATTSAATSSRCSSSRARRRSTTSPTNQVPGATDRDRGYWRDVGTIDAYYDAHMDLIAVHPIFNLYNADWPIHTWIDPLPPAKFVFDEDERRGQALDCMVCARRRDLRRHRAPLGALARRAPALLLARRGLDPACTASQVHRSAVVRRRDPRQERADRRTGAEIGVDPEARPRALPRLRAAAIVVIPQGHGGGGMKASTCSRASTRRTSTAAPACTSSTWRASCAGSRS